MVMKTNALKTLAFFNCNNFRLYLLECVGFFPKMKAMEQYSIIFYLSFVNLANQLTRTYCRYFAKFWNFAIDSLTHSYLRNMCRRQRPFFVGFFLYLYWKGRKKYHFFTFCCCLFVLSFHMQHLPGFFPIFPHGPVSLVEYKIKQT